MLLKKLLNETNKKAQTANRRLTKKRVQCLNEASYFVSSSVLVDSIVLRNPLLREAPKCVRQGMSNILFIKSSL